MLLALGEREQAKAHALVTYKQAWGDGPPYSHWKTLERAKQLLQALGAPEPSLDSAEPTSLPPIPFEDEIRTLIAKQTPRQSTITTQSHP